MRREKKKVALVWLMNHGEEAPCGKQASASLCWLFAVCTFSIIERRKRYLVQAFRSKMQRTTTFLKYAVRSSLSGNTVGIKLTPQLLSYQYQSRRSFTDVAATSASKESTATVSPSSSAKTSKEESTTTSSFHQSNFKEINNIVITKTTNPT